MRRSLGLLAAVVLASQAWASQASWPITPSVEYPASLSSGQGMARVHVFVGADASAIHIEVYGLDGMRVGTDNLVRVDRDRGAAGTNVDFDVPFTPGPGRSLLVVSARAEVANAGSGTTVRSFPFGAENAAQQQDHFRCVRQDPDGIWIRLQDCDDSAAQAPEVAATADTASPALFDVPTFLSAPPVPGKVVVIDGYVIDTYLCPPCPKGAMCKPCAVNSSVFLAAAPSHAAFSLSSPPADIAVISAADPGAFRPGAKVRLQVRATRRAEGGFDGILVGAE